LPFNFGDLWQFWHLWQLPSSALIRMNPG